MPNAITSKERCVIVNALRLAADQYDTDAKACEGQPRIAGQFAAQAVEARMLADRMED